MSRKNIILIVIAGITIGCVLFGTYYHVGKFTKRIVHNFPFIWDLSIFDDDKIDEIFDEDFEDDWIEEVNDKKDKERGRKSRNPYSFSNKSIEAFNSLDLSAQVMGIDIIKGDSFNLSVTSNKQYLIPEYSVKDGVLRIEQNTPKVMHGANNCHLRLVVPERTKLETMDIKVNVGAVRLKGFDCEECFIQTDVGEITIRDMNYATMDLSSNVGNITVEYLDNLNDYEIRADTDVGHVSVDGEKHKNSYRQAGNSTKSITASTNVGNIKLH